MPIGGGDDIGAGKRGGEVSGLRRMRHLDQLAAQFRRLTRQSAGVNPCAGAADGNIHRPVPIALLLQGLWTYLEDSLASSLLKRSAQRITSSMPRSNEMASRQPSSVRSLVVSSMYAVSLPGLSGAISTQSSKDFRSCFRMVSTSVRIETSSWPEI